MSGAPVRLADGLWHWRARHPEWHPGEFGREVGSFAVDAHGVVLLVDPLLPAEPGAVLAALDEIVGDRLAIVVTIPYHVRSSEELWRRYRDRADVTIHGHPAAARRLGDASAFRAVEPGDALPGGVTAHAIGRPRRYEMPLHLPSHRALCFGDAMVVTPQGDLRVWLAERVDERRLHWYRERLMP
ncbi:MAG TPA: hypothetical protein VLB47_08250, partial [Solirubrobacteraceae bacterium]|nr:hypothetical protein [Solirubrobacteraceae bacterium]